MEGVFLENSIQNHGVEYLVHFTRCDNLKNIFKYGLLNRTYISNHSIDSDFNDSYRMDGYENAICTSISFPNYKMFYRLRVDNPNVKWVIIVINKKILLEKECAFCIDNAASNSERLIPIQIKKGKKAFNYLFDEYPNQVSRSVLGIDYNMTTNPQSEVLVFGNIELKYIFGLLFENKHDQKEYKKYIPEGIGDIVRSDFFKGRKDYEYWR